MEFTEVGNKICSTKPIMNLKEVDPKILNLSPDKKIMCGIYKAGQKKKKSKRKSKRKYKKKSKRKSKKKSKRKN